MNLTLHFKKFYFSSEYNLNKLGCLISSSPKTVKNIIFLYKHYFCCGKERNN